MMTLRTPNMSPRGWMIRSVLVLSAVAALGAPRPLDAQAAAPSPAAQAAGQLLAAQDWVGAAEAYRSVVAQEPGNGLAWLRLGRALVEMGQGDQALEALSNVAGTGFQTPFLQVFQARAMTQLGRREQALSTLEQIQPTPALGGAAFLTGITEFADYVGTPRFDALVEAVEAAAWPCRADPISREFDFWLGDWDVYVGGALAGTNTIELMLGDCNLLENWSSTGNRDGKSFNWVDRSSFRTPRWRQLWVADNGGTLDYYNGHYSDGAMRFDGHTFTPTGDSIPQKLRFENIAADTVRQVFEQSNDGGATWIITFDGLYIRRR